jgi:hypothetical protein
MYGACCRRGGDPLAGLGGGSEVDDEAGDRRLSLERLLRAGVRVWLASSPDRHGHLSVSAMLYDEDHQKEVERSGHVCDWCHSREAEEEHLVFGLGRLNLCEECAMMLLASIVDSG